MSAAAQALLDELRALGVELQAEGERLRYLRLRIGDLVIDGATLRCSADGRTIVRFPEKPDGAGIRRPYVLPAKREAHVPLERAMFEAVGLPSGSSEGGGG